jgi:hypothetical protein
MRNQYLKVLLISIVTIAGFWLWGYSLAPNKSALLQSHSWLYQLAWFPIHVLLAYFSVLAYKKAAYGQRHQDITLRSLVYDLKKNSRAIVISLLMVTPFVIQDLMEGMDQLQRDYDTLGNATWVMIGPVWVMEWLMLAVIWSRVIASIRLTITTYSPKYVREHLDDLLIVNPISPLLQLGVENALINLFYAISTIGYIEFAGGEAADFQDVVISAVLVLFSFLSSFFYMRKRIGDALESIVAEHVRRIELVYGHHDPELMKHEFLNQKLNFELINHFVFDKTAGLSRRSYERLSIVRSSLLIESIQKSGYADSLAVDYGLQAMRYTQYEIRLASLGIEELQGVLIRLGSPAAMYLLKSGVLSGA